MKVIIILLALTIAGTGLAALMAGGCTARKKALLWSCGGVLWALSGGIFAFFQQNAAEKILLQKAPILPHINIPGAIMAGIGGTVFFCGLFLFLYIFNCRKNSKKWYWAIP